MGYEKLSLQQGIPQLGIGKGGGHFCGRELGYSVSMPRMQGLVDACMSGVAALLGFLILGSTGRSVQSEEQYRIQNMSFREVQGPKQV